MKKDLADALKGKLNLGGGSKGKGEEGNSKKQLAALLTIGGLVGILVTIFGGLQPILDIIKFILMMLFVLVLKSVQWLVKELPGLLSEIWEKITDPLKNAWDTLKDIYASVIEFFKALPEKISTFFNELPGKIWAFLKEGFTTVSTAIATWLISAIEWLKNLPANIWALLILGFDAVKNLLSNVWNTLVEKFTLVVDWFKTIWSLFSDKITLVWNVLKELPEKIWTLLKEGFNWLKDRLIDAWNAINELPSKIWDFIKGLPELIANAIKGFFGGLGSFFGLGGKSTTVGDAIIRPDGSVIKTNPNDTLIATQNPGGQGGGDKYFYFYGVTEDQFIDKIKRELMTDVLKAGRY